MDRGRRGGSAGLLSNQIEDTDFGGGGGRSERDGDPSMWRKGVFRGKHAKGGHTRFISRSLIRVPLSKRGRGRRRRTAKNGHEQSRWQFKTQAQQHPAIQHTFLQRLNDIVSARNGQVASISVAYFMQTNCTIRECPRITKDAMKLQH